MAAVAATILATFDLQVSLILHTKFRVIGFLVQAKNIKIHFSNGSYDRNPGFPIKKSLTILDLEVTLILPTKFRPNDYSVQEKLFKIDFKLTTILDFRSERF